MQGRLTVLLLCMLAFQAHGAFKKDDEAFALRQPSWSSGARRRGARSWHRCAKPPSSSA